MDKIINLEYEMYLNGYTIKQIAALLNISSIKVRYDINKIQKTNNKQLVNKGLKISFN